MGFENGLITWCIWAALSTVSPSSLTAKEDRWSTDAGSVLQREKTSEQAPRRRKIVAEGRGMARTSWPLPRHAESKPI
ncbi:hypothetical protein CYMTET_23614 [Cymbomonas tetramitiformis]|uniref:Secreted protein n=1 Tax=Cymbomonas tetramitiformis TaxID=36881 RepID=A0AAE0FYA3_9CHLO|nr:hypothetical protein CYMTET_23614 [Cymbomonas tetramitiformis]